MTTIANGSQKNILDLRIGYVDLVLLEGCLGRLPFFSDDEVVWESGLVVPSSGTYQGAGSGSNESSPQSTGGGCSGGSWTRAAAATDSVGVAAPAAALVLLGLKLLLLAGSLVGCSPV